MPGSGAQIDWNNTDPTNLIEQIRAMPETSERFPDRIAACRRALEWVQREERLDQWAWLHAEIGFCLLASSVDNSDDNLRQAIAHYEKALDVYTPDISPKEWLGASRNLARAYKRWTGGDRATNLERAIQLQGEILRVYMREQSPQTWVQTHAELAYLYLHRIQGSEISNLEQALAHYQRTLEVWRRETYPIQWAKVQYNIGTTIFRLQRLGENRAAYQKRAIEHLEQALEVLTPETAFREWVKVQHSLGLAYAEYRQGDRVNSLTRAIGLLEEVSEVCQRANLHVERAQAQNALGIAYLQSTHGGRSENVERAIGHFRQALETQEQVGPPEQKALTLHNLSVAHTDRLLEDRTENLRQALVYGQAALDTIEQYPHTFSNWAMIKTGLAGALWKLATNLRQRGEQRQAIDRLEDAIKHGEEVVSALQRRSLPYWQAFACYNLANAYSDRIEGSRAKNRGQAIVCYHRALKFFNKENFPDRWANAHNDLAIIYLERSGRKGLGSTKKAIQHFNHALEVFEPDAFPISTLRVARNLGNLYFDLRRWQDAIEPYCQALDATERLYRFSVMRVSKETEIGETADLYRRNAYVLACSGDLRGAVVAMERGRARLLSEVLQREYADLETLGRSHPNLYQQYRQSASEIADLTRMDLSSRDQSSITALAPEMRKARRALDQAVEAIRQILDYEDFLAPPQFEDIVKAVRPGAPLVYIVVTPAGTVALVVTPTAVHTVHTDLTEEALHKRIAGQPGVLGGYLGAYDAWRHAPRDPAAHQAWFDTLNDTIHWLWGTLMGPIIRTLTDLDITHATLIPSSWLAFLPLHAAQASLTLPCTRGREEGATYALDQVAFSYAPSARALSAAQIAAAAAPGTRLFAVDNPDGSLRFSRQEVNEIARYFPGQEREPWIVRGRQATRNTVLHALLNHDVYHFACHGSNVWAAPLESHLGLYGYSLTVRDLLEQRGTRARLAFLSACETGLVGATLPDEVVGLASGFLQAGAAGVVSTLWAVNDLSTARLAGRFYRHWKEDGMTPPDALAAAQRWLRDEADNGRWSHPYYWAGFTLTGV